MSYVQVPILAKFTFKEKFYAATGPQVGFLISAKDKGKTVNDSGDLIDGTTDIKKSTEGFDFSWGIGAGYKLPFGLGFNVKYNFGLTKVFKNNNTDLGLGDFNGLFKERNIVYQVGIFYVFGGGNSED